MGCEEINHIKIMFQNTVINHGLIRRLIRREEDDIGAMDSVGLSKQDIAYFTED